MTPVLLGLLGEVEGALELEAVGLLHNEQEWPRWPYVSVLGACVAPRGTWNSLDGLDEVCTGGCSTRTLPPFLQSPGAVAEVGRWPGGWWSPER